MSYIYCTIAIGKKYLDIAIEFAKELNNKSNTHKVLIVTDEESLDIPNTYFIPFDKNNVTFIQNIFNYNLKYIPMMECSKLYYNFIIFIDADWRLHELYKEEKILEFLDKFDKSEYDFIFERPHTIGVHKYNKATCFWKHKIEPYKLLQTRKYDDAHVVNEQFMVFKNNDKFKIFCDRWKERNDFGIQNNIWAFAEGLEIGMSAIDANMTMNWQLMRSLKQCFRFQNNTGISFERF
jgi:hypothetical protein